MRWLSCSVVLAVLLATIVVPAVEAQSSPAANDWTGTPEQRAFGLAVIWAEAKHGFPSFTHVPELDWDRSFQEFLPRVLATESRDEYYRVLMEFAGLLEDGHTSVLPPWGYLRPDFDNPPLEVQVVGDAFVVARAAATPELEAARVRAGLEIVKIDGRETRAYFEDAVNRFYPRGSSHANDALNIVYLLRGPRGSKVVLEVRDADGDTREVALTRSSLQPDGSPFLPRVLLWMTNDSPLEQRRMPDRVMYVRIAHFENPKTAEEFLELIDGLAKEDATRLLIDLRFTLGGRSDIAETMIGALIDREVSSPLWKYPHHTPARTSWGQSQEWSTARHMIPPRDGARFMGPVVILTGGTTSSTAEDFAISLREAGRARLVGERTAGSAGNPISIPLPGGGMFMMATFRAFLPDGGEYVGVGLRPDIELQPSREDIGTGHDPVIALALDVLRGE